MRDFLWFYVKLICKPKNCRVMIFYGQQFLPDLNEIKAGLAA